MHVSVIINNHNYRPYLRACIDSALNQTYPDGHEVTVVDDGSTDGSPDILRAYGSRIVPVLKTNEGQASTFNAGFEVAGGDILIFLDSDDLLEPFAATTVAELLAEPDVIKAHWPLRVVDHDGSPTGALKPGLAAELPEGDLRTTVFARGPNSLLFPPTSGNAWSRAFLERVMPMDTGLFRLGADTFLSKWRPSPARCGAGIRHCPATESITSTGGGGSASTRSSRENCTSTKPACPSRSASARSRGFRSIQTNGGSTPGGTGLTKLFAASTPWSDRAGPTCWWTTAHGGWAALRCGSHGPS